MSGKWILCRFPAIADGLPGDPTGRSLGESLSPQRYPVEALDVIREKDPAFFAGHYQGDPVAATGLYFKPEDFIHRVPIHSIPAVKQWVLAFDLAAKTKDTHDYTCGAVMGLTTDGRLVIKDVFRWRKEYPDAKLEVIRVAKLYGAAVILAIEDKSAGTQLLQELSRDPRLGNHAIVPVKASVDKKQRANVWASRARMGRLVLVEGSWNEEFIAECLAFDGLGLVHDDQVDAISVGWSVLNLEIESTDEQQPDPSTIPGSIEFYDRLAQQQLQTDDDSEW